MWEEGSRPRLCKCPGNVKRRTKGVANLELYKEYAKASFRAFPAMLAEMAEKKRLALKFRAQCDRRTYLDHLVGAFMKMDPDLVFYGNGRVNHARGSPCVATKKAMRAFGRRVATVPSRRLYVLKMSPLQSASKNASTRRTSK